MGSFTGSPDAGKLHVRWERGLGPDDRVVPPNLIARYLPQGRVRDFRSHSHNSQCIRCNRIPQRSFRPEPFYVQEGAAQPSVAQHLSPPMAAIL